jgi:uncharacterized integral membrane protein
MAAARRQTIFQRTIADLSANDLAHCRSRRSVEDVTNPPPPGQPWQTPTTPGLGTPGTTGQSPAIPDSTLPGAPAKRRRAISPKLIIGVLLLAALIWFIAVNTRDAKITLWIPAYNIPVWIVLLGTFVVGWVVGWLFRKRRQAVRARAIKNNL